MFKLRRLRLFSGKRVVLTGFVVVWPVGGPHGRDNKNQTGGTRAESCSQPQPGNGMTVGKQQPRRSLQIQHIVRAGGEGAKASNPRNLSGCTDSPDSPDSRIHVEIR